MAPQLKLYLDLSISGNSRYLIDWNLKHEIIIMFTNKEVLEGLTELCARHGQTIEEREAAFGCEVGEFRKTLHPPEDPLLTRNLRVVLGALQLDGDEFMEICSEQAGRSL